MTSITGTNGVTHPHRLRRIVRTAVALAALALAEPAIAQMSGTPAPGYRREPGAVASAVPAPLREIGFDQHLNQRLPLDAEFLDEHGQQVLLGSYFGQRPVVLAFVYYECPMLCTQVLSSLASTPRSRCNCS